MIRAHYTKAAISAVLLLSLSACGWFGGHRAGGSTPSADQLAMRQRADAQRAALARANGEDDKRNTLFGLFANSANPNTTVEVNKYLWKASLEVLDFLPIESVDPFTGVIVTGYGTPPGSGRAYRATIYVQDPALDARSLKISLQTKGGAPVDPETARAVEDAIMTRARQLRIADSKL